MSTGSALRQWQNGLASESFRCTPSARKQHVLQRRHGQLLQDFPFEKSARDSCSTRGHSAWSRCRPSSVAATAPLKQTVALQYPDRHIASAPVTSRSRADVAGAHSRRGSFSARGSDRPVPRTLHHVDRKQGLHVQRHVRVRQVSGEIRTCAQDSTAGPTSRRQECETPCKTNSRSRHGEAGPESARSGKSRTFAAHRHDGKAEACHVCQARYASSHVLIGERGRTRANTHRHFLLRRREAERAQTLARALHRSDHWS